MLGGCGKEIKKTKELKMCIKKIVLLQKKMGRKKVLDKKQVVRLFVLSSELDILGGIDNVKTLCGEYIARKAMAKGRELRSVAKKIKQ